MLAHDGTIPYLCQACRATNSVINKISRSWRSLSMTVEISIAVDFSYNGTSWRKNCELTRAINSQTKWCLQVLALSNTWSNPISSRDRHMSGPVSFSTKWKFKSLLINTGIGANLLLFRVRDNTVSDFFYANSSRIVSYQQIATRHNGLRRMSYSFGFRWTHTISFNAFSQKAGTLLSLNMLSYGGSRRNGFW